MKLSVNHWAKVRLWAVVSTVLAAWFAIVMPAAAHEVLPMIGDMEAQDGRLTFSLEGNFESLVAGVNLEGLEDTNAAPQDEAARYDALRGLDTSAFGDAVTTFFPEMSGQMSVIIDGVPAALRLDSIEVSEQPDPETVRVSTLRFSADLPPGAETFQIDWPAAFGVLVLRQMGVEAGWDGYLTGGLSDVVSLSGGDAMSGWQGFLTYIPVGVEHIIPLGLDHILFVLGLFFLSTHLRPLLWQVSAFTLAHTITLALAALGYVSVPASIVEPIIAASIVYVAVENVFSRGLNPWRPFVIFGFGLLHGLGFASVLGQYGLPDEAFIPALVGFNIGVEIGQLAVISVAYIIVVWAMRLSEDGKINRLASIAYMGVAMVIIPLAIIPLNAMGADAVAAFLPLMFMAAALAGLASASCAVERYETYRHMVAMPASIAIALIGSYWVVERVFL